jgi:hypothetical protein
MKPNLNLVSKTSDPKTGKISIETSEQDNSGDFIIMKAIVFPWINASLGWNNYYGYWILFRYF